MTLPETPDKLDEQQLGVAPGDRSVVDTGVNDTREDFDQWLANLDPEMERAILVRAYQQQSSNVGTGGRVVDLSLQELRAETRPGEHLRRAHVFFFNAAK